MNIQGYNKFLSGILYSAVSCFSLTHRYLIYLYYNNTLIKYDMCSPFLYIGMIIVYFAHQIIDINDHDKIN